VWDFQGLYWRERAVGTHVLPPGPGRVHAENLEMRLTGIRQATDWLRRLVRNRLGRIALAVSGEQQSQAFAKSQCSSQVIDFDERDDSSDQGIASCGVVWCSLPFSPVTLVHSIQKMPAMYGGEAPQRPLSCEVDMSCPFKLGALGWHSFPCRH
jgi:hypothetical protein